MDLSKLVNLPDDVVLGVRDNESEYSKDFYPLMQTYISNQSLHLSHYNCVFRNRYDELVELGNYIMGTTLKNWNPDKGRYFYYFTKAYHNELISFAGRLESDKRKTLHSFDDPYGQGKVTGEEVYGEKDINIGNSYDRDLVLNRINENYKIFDDEIAKKVFALRLKNTRFDEIAKQLNITEKTARNLMVKVRKNLLK